MSLSFGELAKNSFSDFFHLPSDYHFRIAGYTNPHLKRQEAVKTRQIYGALCSIANGAAFSVTSHGGTLVVCAWAARRLYVAIRKLKLIKTELTIRGIELRPFLNRDWMIPVAIAVIGVGVGLGVDFGLQGLVPIGQVSFGTGSGSTTTGIFAMPSGKSLATAGLPVPSGNSMTQVVVAVPHGDVATQAAHPLIHSTVMNQAVNQNMLAPVSYGQQASAVAHNTGSALHGFHQGVVSQVQHVFGSTPGPVTAAFGGVYDTSLANAAGFVGGAHAAQQTEESLTVLLGSQSLQWMSEKLDVEGLRPRMAMNLSCRRLPWSTGVLCNRCEFPIRGGHFFHRCDCLDENDLEDDNEYNLCLRCHSELPADQIQKQGLRSMQLAVPGEMFHPALNAEAMKTILGPKELLCMFCEFVITQGWYYDCWDCRQDKARWVSCFRCYTEGAACRGGANHRWYAFSRARLADFDAHTPYQSWGGKKAKETGRASCSRCHIPVERGAYYHCSKCDKGDFVLCRDCYQTGDHCDNSSHVLKKYYAWKYKRDYTRRSAGNWRCSNPRCLDPGRKTKFFFSCLEVQCNNREHGLCPPCYFTDLSCPNKNHDIFKCYFK